MPSLERESSRANSRGANLSRYARLHAALIYDARTRGCCGGGLPTGILCSARSSNVCSTRVVMQLDFVRTGEPRVDGPVNPKYKPHASRVSAGGYLGLVYMIAYAGTRLAARQV